MVRGMRNFIQSVMIQEKVYVGGGDTALLSNNKDHIVMEYDTRLGKWDELAPYKACSFAMTKINNCLVLVGGIKPGVISKMLAVWKAKDKKWTRPYPKMSMARSHCSAITYEEWLVVAGGWSEEENPLSSVEIMNANNKQWYIGPPTPIPWSSMKTATVGDTCYFMGGVIEGNPTDEVYSMSLSALTCKLLDPRNSEGEKSIWKEVPGLQVTQSTPISISGSLLAIGGKKDVFTTAILLYESKTGNWVEVGNLPALHFQCTSVMITDREMLVAGGWSKTGPARTDIALIG